MKKISRKDLTSQSGFTLVELIVVMVIIGALAAMLLVNFQNARVRSRDAVRKADLRNIKSALQIYYNDYQFFPDDNSDSGDIYGCGTGGASVCPWGDPFVSDGTQYINAIPTDPLNAGSNIYIYDQLSLDRYNLYVTLENASDQDIVASQVRCDAAVDDANDPDLVAGRYLICND